jgi:hypothetical protein
MNVNFSLPLSNGFERMKKALFQPFDISKWLNIGFTAFLAGLTDCHGGGGNGNSGTMWNDFDWDDFFSFPETAGDWLFSHPIWLILIIAGVFLMIIIAVVLSWLSSRGKFMFLYNVVNNRDEVVSPWNEFRRQGNSLFWWQFVYGWLIFGIFILFFVYSFGIFKNIHDGQIPAVAKFGFIFGIVFTFIGLLLFTGYVSLFLKDFIVPIMYKHRISATRAWSKFLSLAVHNMGSFFVYGLFIFVLGIAVVIAVILFAVMTCCIGLLLIMIPFVGAVILLPVSYTFRAFSIEYLATFGDEFNVFQKTDDELKEEMINV